jgi:autotransporter-associated beta strand protein
VDASSTLWSVGGANVVLSASTLVEMPARLAGTLGFPASGYDLVKYGAAYLRVSDPNTFSHKLGIYDGPLRGTAMSAGSPFGTAAVELNQSGGLRLDAVAGVSDTPMGKLNPHSGAPSLQVVGVSGGGTWTATDLQRDNRAVLTVLGSGGAALQTTDKFKIAAAPAVVNGMAAPYLVEASGDFLTYNAGGRGIERVASYTAGDINAAGAASVYSAPSAQTLTANREVYALKTGANISGANVDLTVGSGGVVVNGAATIDCNLQFNGQEGVIWNSATLAVNGAIKGTNGLTKAGVGTLTLNTNNTYAGVTTVNAGSLLLGVSDALPTNQPLALANVTFDLNGKNQTLGGLTIGAGALQNNSVAASTLGLSGTVVYNGVTGRANIAPPMGKTLSIVLGGATTFDVADGADYPDLRVGYYENYQDCPVAISGASAPVTKNGAGALHFRGANTFAGTVTVNRGVLSGEFFSAPLSPFGNTSNPMVLNGNGTVVCGNGGTWTFGPVSFSGGNALQFTAGSAPASWTIPSVTRAAGSRGTLVFAGNAFGGTYNDHLLANLSLFVTGWMSPDPNVNGMLPACCVLTPYLVNGFASHAVVNTGTGRTTPAGYDQTTFTGATATKKVDLAAAAALGADANIWALRTSYNVTVSAGSPTLTLGSGGLIANATCTISPSLKFGATGAAEGLVYVAPSQNATCGGQLLTTTGLTKFGGGVLSLNAASPSYAGDTWVHAGTLSLRDAQALGTGSEPIYLQYGATLEIGDPFTVNRPIVGAGRIGTGNGPFTLGPTGSLTPLTNTIATLSVEEMNFQGTYNWEYNESGADLIKVANLSFSGAPKVAVTWIGSGEAPKGTNTVFTYLGSDPAIDGLTARAPAGLQGRFQLDTANKQVKLVIETFVPRGTVILVF